MDISKNILFVCVENAGRSQMAEAFFKKFAKNRFNVISAGTSPSSIINPMVVSVVTLNVSDDANSFIVPDNSIWYRVSRQDNVYALHAATDGKIWQLIRVFTLGKETKNHKVGFLAQSPTGEGCEILFEEINFLQKRLIELRDGS